MPLQLRLARAALCDRVCDHDPHAGVDLVGAIQVGLGQTLVKPGVNWLLSPGKS